MADTWDPQRYLTFGDERTQPVVDLVSRVPLAAPATVVDLGCGPGNSTAVLRSRFPHADILGLDSSAAMIEAARTSLSDPRTRFEQGDLTAWAQDAATAPADLVFANAVLQWLPDHRAFLPRLLEATGHVLAFQVPGNEGSPTHEIVAELAAQPPFADHVPPVHAYGVADPADYIDDLTGPAWRVDAWETTYVHVLSGPDPVYAWISSTGARPILEALNGELRDRFADRLKAAFQEAYPPAGYGTLLPFRRVFVVATRTGAAHTAPGEIS